MARRAILLIHRRSSPTSSAHSQLNRFPSFSFTGARGRRALLCMHFVGRLAYRAAARDSPSGDCDFDCHLIPIDGRPVLLPAIFLQSDGPLIAT